jgi:hypothetical protein
MCKEYYVLEIDNLVIRKKHFMVDVGVINVFLNIAFDNNYCGCGIYYV